MVSRASNQSKAIGQRRHHRIVGFLMLALLVAAMAMVISLMITGMKQQNQADFKDDISTSADEASAEENSANDSVEAQNSEEDEDAELPARVDFQGTVDMWAEGVDGEKSVLIYDIERDEMVGQYNADAQYNTASLYKLFVVYEGYRRIQSGAWQGEEMVGTTGYTVLECLDLSIRESYSPCAEGLWQRIGHAELDDIIEQVFDIKNSNISALISNPRDILAIMRIFYNHTEIKDAALVTKMQDSFLNQPATTYNWRQGLPSGFSNRARVYNKVGWEWGGSSWNLYHDAAIVEFAEQGRHFIVVVMTKQVPFERIRDFGGLMEQSYWEQAV